MPIPRRVVQIWIGPRAPPEKCMSTWRDFCSRFGWEYRLFREADIDAFGLKNRSAYDQSSSMCERADIARYEILHRLGGLYLDADVFWLGKDLSQFIPFDHSDFIAVLEKSEVHPGHETFFACNGIFASAVGHPILTRAISMLPSRGYGANIRGVTNPVAFRTGPYLLCDAIRAANVPITLLPAQFCFPVDHKVASGTTNPMAYANSGALMFVYNFAEHGRLTAAGAGAPRASSAVSHQGSALGIRARFTRAGRLRPSPVPQPAVPALRNALRQRSGSAGSTLRGLVRRWRA